MNRNNQWEWEGNGNKTRLNLGLGMGMGIKHWEWERMGLKKIFPLISTSNVLVLFALSKQQTYMVHVSTISESIASHTVLQT